MLLLLPSHSSFLPFTALLLGAVLVALCSGRCSARCLSPLGVLLVSTLIIVTLAILILLLSHP